MKTRLGFAVALAITVLGCSARLTSPPSAPQTPAPGQIIFGTGGIDRTGTTITGVVTCLNPAIPMGYVARFTDATDGHVDLMVARGSDASRLFKSYELVGVPFDTFSDTFRQFDFVGSAQFTFALVSEGGTSIATGSLWVDSWPPTQCVADTSSPGTANATSEP
jgi:hypothetical protein